MAAGGEVAGERLPIANAGYSEFFTAIHVETRPVPAALGSVPVIEGERAGLFQRDFERQGRACVTFAAVAALCVVAVAFGDDLPRIAGIVIIAQSMANAVVGHGVDGIAVALLHLLIVGDEDDRSGRDGELAYGRLNAFQPHLCGIGSDVLSLGNLNAVRVIGDCGHGQPVAPRPPGRAGVGQGVLAVIGFVYRLGVQRLGAKRAAGNAAFCRVGSAACIVGIRPIMGMRPLGIKRHVLCNRQGVARCVGSAASVSRCVPAAEDKVGLRKTIAAGNRYSALNVDLAGCRPGSAVGVEGDGVGQIGVHCIAGLRDENRNALHIHHILDGERIPGVYLRGLRTILDIPVALAVVVLLLFRKDHDAVRGLVGICDDPRQRVKRIRRGQLGQIVQTADLNVFSLNRNPGAAVPHDINLGAPVCHLFN